MLAKKRGALRDKSRKMAKKAQAALQADITTDDEWEKFLQKPGLILADIYSEWSGPCTGMVGILKKIKMEIGGDDLSYATARCDNITSLARFRGKSEPAWMFIRDGKMINLMFGANSPRLADTLTRELRRMKKAQPPDFSLPVSEIGPLEAERLKAIELVNLAKNAARQAELEAIAREKYEALLTHLLRVLSNETCAILFPWVFRNEDGSKREKRASPPYAEFAEQLLPGNFSNEQEVWLELDEDIIADLENETDYYLCDETKRLLMDGKALCMRLKCKIPDADIDQLLIDLIYGQPRVADSPDTLLEDCYIRHHLPPPSEFRDTFSEEGLSENSLYLTTIWIPLNIKNRVVAIRTLFTKYVDSTFPFGDPDEDIPKALFKFDGTRRKELKEVLEEYSSEVMNFGIFERDKLPDPKLLTKKLDRFEEMENKTGYEVFVVFIKIVGNHGFLSFAGLGPYHISETHEEALEEAQDYFPKKEEAVKEKKVEEKVEEKNIIEKKEKEEEEEGEDTDQIDT